MPIPTFNDHDPLIRRVELGDVGQPDYCMAEMVGANGEERFALLRYSQGESDYWPADWSLIAPHEMLINGLPVHWKP